MKLIIRDSYATLNGKKNEIVEMESGALEILGDDGRAMFDIKLIKGGVEISTVTTCKQEGIMYDDKFRIIPVASNKIEISLKEYKYS